MESSGAPIPQFGEAGSEVRAEAPLRICLLSLAGECFAVDLRNVREVFEVEAVTVVPGMPPVLAGVANLRGVVIPLVDLRPMLGLSASGSLPPFAVVIQHGTQQVGVLVDQVPEIRTVRKDELLQALSQEGRGATPFVTAIVRLDDRIGGVVEVPTLLTYVETGG